MKRSFLNKPFVKNRHTPFLPLLNTDISFGNKLPLHIPTALESQGVSLSHSTEHFTYNPEDYVHPANHHKPEPHVHDTILENFSWAIVTPLDSLLDQHKKRLIKTQPSSQYGCGSCWAISLADTMGDCLVVSGATGWSPNISATYIMMCISDSQIHNFCGGGNPAAAAKFLEGVGVADTSCVDYSWCIDNKMCTDVASVNHFDAKQIVSQLNQTIPRPLGCYFSNVDKFMYKIDKGSETFRIDEDIPIDVFRNTVKSHILDFGPVIGGFVVLKNFISGAHTSSSLNDGVYFDRADYSSYVQGQPLKFNDEMLFQTAGLHAVSIVGWGIATNIQYDTNKWGDVPYWHCRNSWSSDWGKQNGFFKCAMYPFNKFSQFDKQVITASGGPVGSVIFIRATSKPEIVKYDEIDISYNQKIQTKIRPISYYKGDTIYVSDSNKKQLKKSHNYHFLVVIIVAVVLFIYMLY